MLDPAWHDVLSGRRRGAGAALCRGVLSLCAPLYGAAVALRNLAFDRGWRSVHRAAVPVVSVGNLTTGGTGKTPLVAWIVGELQRQGAAPGILSRGYGSAAGAPNDERLVLELLCPRVPHVQTPDRVAGAEILVEQHRCDVLILDDGFQHRRLGRDLDIVLLDALRPWGYGALLPRGLLREPPAALRRAGLVCLTRVDQCDEEQLRRLREQVRRCTAAPLLEVVFRPTRLLNAAGETAPPSKLQSCSLGAVCGIGNPEAFRRTLTSIGAPIAEQRFQAYPDHHAYGESDRRRLAEWTACEGIELVVVTLKDLVKLPWVRLGTAALWGLEVGVEFRSGQSQLEGALEGLMRRSRGRTDRTPPPASELHAPIDTASDPS